MRRNSAASAQMRLLKGGPAMAMIAQIADLNAACYVNSMNDEDQFVRAEEASGIRVRLAQDDDWTAIWPIMSAVAKAGNTFTYPIDLSKNDGRSLWMAGARTIVATDEAERVLGTAKMGPNQMGPGSHVATGSFMVGESARGRGVGRCLGEALIDWARDTGFRSIQFNAVVATNLVAIGLWQSLGFKIVGTVPGAFAHPEEGDVALHVMHRTT
jgi:GNAT superfamily N-acetyltransferase